MYQLLQLLTQIITVQMNLQSPTTLLSSIQSMRDKLRSDKLMLQDIKNQFNHYSKKPRPSPIQTIFEESLQDITYNQNLSLRKDDLSVQKKQKAKVFQLKKEHQKEITRLKQEHQRQMFEIRASYQEQKRAIEQNWRQKYNQQSKYIAILQEQVSSPIQTQRENVSNQQYDAVINQLLQQNTRLHNHLQQARNQSEEWRKKAKKYMAEMESKARKSILDESESRSRFKIIMKKTNETNQIPNSQRQKCLNMQKSTKSIFIFNDQNTDRSNFSSNWQDFQIQNDEGGVRTIREFAKKGNSQNQPSRAQYLSVKL